MYTICNYILLHIIYYNWYIKAFIKLISKSAQRQLSPHFLLCMRTISSYILFDAVFYSWKLIFTYPKEREKMGRVVGIIRNFISRLMGRILSHRKCRWRRVCMGSWSMSFIYIDNRLRGEDLSQVDKSKWDIKKNTLWGTQGHCNMFQGKDQSYLLCQY